MGAYGTCTDTEVARHGRTELTGQDLTEQELSGHALIRKWELAWQDLPLGVHLIG